MAHIVAEPCIKCKYMDCVETCPVMCFYEGENMLVIHPEECIDCGACIDACPVEAIYEESELPDKWHEYIELNAKYSEVWPVIEQKGKSPTDSDDWKEVENKREHLSPNPGNSGT